MSFTGTKGEWISRKTVGNNSVKIIDEDGDLIAKVEYRTDETESNVNLIINAPEMYNKVESVLCMSEERGVSGCTWGDTDFDSLSVAYGFNLALEYIKEKLEK